MSLNSSYNYGNADIGIYLYDSRGINTPNKPLISGIQNVYLSQIKYYPNYPLYVTN